MLDLNGLSTSEALDRCNADQSPEGLGEVIQVLGKAAIVVDTGERVLSVTYLGGRTALPVVSLGAIGDSDASRRYCGDGAIHLIHVAAAWAQTGSSQGKRMQIFPGRLPRCCDLEYRQNGP